MTIAAIFKKLYDKILYTNQKVKAKLIKKKISALHWLLLGCDFHF